MSHIKPSLEDVRCILDANGKLLLAESWILELAEKWRREFACPPNIFDGPEIGFRLAGYRRPVRPDDNPVDDYANVLFETVEMGVERGLLLDSGLNWNIELPHVEVFGDAWFSYFFHAIWDAFLWKDLGRFREIALLRIDVPVYDGIVFNVAPRTPPGLAWRKKRFLPPEDHPHHAAAVEDLHSLHALFLRSEDWLRDAIARVETA